MTCSRHYNNLAKTRMRINADGYHVFPQKRRWCTLAQYLVLRQSCPRSRPSFSNLKVSTDWAWNYDSCYYTSYSLSVFWLAKSLQLILEISTTYRLVSCLLADNWLICRLREQCMISNNNINPGSLRRCVCRHFLPKQCIIKQLLDEVFVIP